MKRNIKKPKSNRYSKNYKPDIDYVIENLENSVNYADYLAENLDVYTKYSEYTAESLGGEHNRRGFSILSKGNDYIIVENDNPTNSHWIEEGDYIIDSDKMTHRILRYNLMPSGLYLTLDGHLKLKEGDIIYVK